MGENIIIPPKKETKSATDKSGTKKKPSVFTRVENFLKLDRIFSDGVPVQYFKYVAFVMLLALGYIWLTHKSDRLVRDYERVKLEVKDIKTEYTALKKSYMFESKQTEVAKKVKEMGLEPSDKPPYKIIVRED